ncbi:MAG: LemA family protein [bacterium]
MKKTVIAVVIVLVILLIPVLIAGCGYNTLVRQQESVDTAWSEVENQLQRRNDLIPNLVQTVKGYASHEREIFTQIAEARSKLAGAESVKDKSEANGELRSALSRLLVIVERYPNLKANQNFQRLQDELAGTENRIAVARRRYNEAAKQYNISIRSFPTFITAALFGFDKREYFEAPEEAKEVPQVDFGEGGKEAPSKAPAPETP